MGRDDIILLKGGPGRIMIWPYPIFLPQIISPSLPHMVMEPAYL